MQLQAQADARSAETEEAFAHVEVLDAELAAAETDRSAVADQASSFPLSFSFCHRRPAETEEAFVHVEVLDAELAAAETDRDALAEQVAFCPSSRLCPLFGSVPLFAHQQ